MKWNDTTSDALIVDAGQHTSDIAWIPARFEDAPNMEATQIANARLIATAPDMLEALEDAKRLLDALRMDSGVGEILTDSQRELYAAVDAKIAAAIAKAQKGGR